MNERIKFVKNYLNWETEKEKGLKHGCRTKLVTRVNKFQKKDLTKKNENEENFSMERIK